MKKQKYRLVKYRNKNVRLKHEFYIAASEFDSLEDALTYKKEHGLRNWKPEPII